MTSYMIDPPLARYLEVEPRESRRLLDPHQRLETLVDLQQVSSTTELRTFSRNLWNAIISPMSPTAWRCESDMLAGRGVLLEPVFAPRRRWDASSMTWRSLVR